MSLARGEKMPASSKSINCSIGLLAAGILGVLLLAGLSLTLSEQARLRFGPPNPELGLRQRLFLPLQLIFQAEELTEPADPLGEEVQFDITMGESVPAITGRLQEAGLISSPGALNDYLLYSGLDTTLQAGKYTLSPQMSPVEIAQALQDPKPTQAVLSILAGWRAEEIAATLPASGLNIAEDDFIRLVYNPASLGSVSGELTDLDTLEGFLFPGVYELPREATLSQLIQTLLDRFESEVSPEMRTAFEMQGLSLSDAVILASIVEREAVVEEEMPTIASVFYNRLALGMPLASDPTVQYALGYNRDQETWWTNPLSAQDLEVDSAYNTYRHPGLPPAPIANPGREALEAVAYPAQTPYYYFRAACDGSGRHNFSQTYTEHLANACP